jgi:hypothetical protein
VNPPPFNMLPSRPAVLRCDGTFVVGGRASFVWETFLMRRASGVPGDYEIRAEQGRPWHRIVWTIEEAEADLGSWGIFGRRRQARARRIRERRAQRGLPVL